MSQPKQPPTDFVRIPLSRGMHAIVDAEDAHTIGGLRWYAHPKGSLWYARRKHLVLGYGFVHVLMHTAITGWGHVDHINGDGLDNRRSNLRPATHAENVRNQRKQSGTQSRFKGVFRHGPSWRAELRVSGQRIRAYRLQTEESAARAYDDLARKHHGEFAALNFPRPGERSAL